MKSILFSLLIMTSTAAADSTWVGNGGSEGDVELAVTQRQVKEAMTVVIKNEEITEYCECNPVFRNRSVCDILNSLDEPRREFCDKTLREQAPQIIRLLETNSDIKYLWTHKLISVKEGDNIRAADAVTNTKTREISVNLPRFLAMKPFERVFLLTHELMHLTQVEGRSISDTESIGPFKESDGSRQLLNSVGAATAVMQGSFPREIRKYRAQLIRSKSYKPIWLEAFFGNSAFQSKSKQTFAAQDYNLGGLQIRYNFGDFGVLAGYRSENRSHTALGTIGVEEKKDILSLGATYRFFLFGDPMTFWGQSHLQIQAQLDWVQAKIKLTEPSTPDLEEKKKKVGGSASVQYYIPMFWGIWHYVGVGYESHRYDYSTVNLKYQKDLTSLFLGVSYAF
ncbi:MAG: hypothetical protein AB7F86_03835 [Bdellovibrionales bacterium]